METRRNKQDKVGMVETKHKGTMHLEDAVGGVLRSSFAGLLRWAIEPSLNNGQRRKGNVKEEESKKKW